ncbi:malonic semialdehyde reductase [Pedomonas mirosovicensis]|uniref:malonic semialdehyde reductase n=1 Tax=Pedomonas mirosovicensis TaxID=2908641 RepID=UPI0021674523|nr:malonic semialdehyde reductase [Pedomonas mirosovicensis]MCH8683991.1 malonic semialdehyde reductase [Pedomonas mirosovicensis]
MGEIISDRSLDTLFRNARTPRAWLDKPVTDVQLRAIYDLMRMAPTSMNSSPARIVFAHSQKARDRLAECASPGNMERIRTAGAVAIIGEDTAFYEKLPELFPPSPTARDLFAGNPALAEATAFRNSSLQGAYLIMAARALGLDCGPMSGFEPDKVNAAFFAGTTIKANFLVALGYGDDDALHPRLPRLSFEDACKIL